MDSKFLTSRRSILKLGIMTAVIAQFWGFSKFAFAQVAAVVDMTKTKRKDKDNEAAVAVLTGLQYVEDADAAEKAGKLKRTDKPFPGGGTYPAKSQYCMTCGLFDQNLVEQGKPGKCMLVTAPVLVAAHGYCATYNVSPKAKKV